MEGGGVDVTELLTCSRLNLTARTGRRAEENPTTAESTRKIVNELLEAFLRIFVFLKSVISFY